MPFNKTNRFFIDYCLFLFALINIGLNSYFQNNYIDYLVLFFILFETRYVIKNNSYASPYFLFLVGWFIPFSISLLPADRYVFFLKSIGKDAKVVFYLVTACFYFISFLFLFNVKRDKLTNWMRPESYQNIFPVSDPLIIALYMISNIGFLASAVSSGFNFPLFSNDVIDSSLSFYSIRGTSTLFNIGLLPFILSIYSVGMSFIQKRKISIRSVLKSKKTIILFFTLVYVIEHLLGGKRMGATITFISGFILIASFYRIPTLKVFIVFCFVSFFIVFNGYIRASVGFERDWQGYKFHALSSAYAYSIFQPVLYVHKSFQYLDEIVKSGERSYKPFGSYTLMLPADEKNMDTDNSHYSDLREKGQMITFASAPIMDGGKLFLAVWSLILFSMIWFFYKHRNERFSMVLYCIFGARLAVAWAGKWLHMGTINEIIPKVIFIFIIYLMASTFMESRKQNDSRSHT